MHFPLFLIIPNNVTLSRFRRISFPLSIRWQQRLEPRVPSHLPLKASEGPQWHPDRRTPAFFCSPWGQLPSAISARPSSTHPHLMSQSCAPEKTKTLRQVGKQSVYYGQRARRGEQIHLWISGISECQVLLPSWQNQGTWMHHRCCTSFNPCVSFPGQPEAAESQWDTT